MTDHMLIENKIVRHLKLFYFCYVTLTLAQHLTSIFEQQLNFYSMKSIRNIAFSALLAIGAFSAITYTSCNSDECKDVECLNGGTCIGGTCACPTGYEGTNCSDLTRAKFIGTWKGSDVCNVNTYNVTLSISAATSEVEALINNPGGFGSSVTITGKVTNSSTLSFTDANVGNGRTLNGTMIVSGNAMTFSYTVTDAIGGSDACNGTYAKQ